MYASFGFYILGINSDNMPYDATVAWHLTMNCYITD